MAVYSMSQVYPPPAVQEYMNFLLNAHFKHLQGYKDSTEPRPHSSVNMAKHTGFAHLEPAYNVMAYVAGANPIGQLSDGSRHDHYELNAGAISTIEGYEGVKLQGQIVNGGDWLTIDPSGTHARVNVKTLVKTAEGGTVGVNWTGHCEVDEKITAILMQQADAATTPFGNLTSYVSLEGPGMDGSCFVGSGRFVLEDGKMAVQTCISRVVAPQEM